MADERGAEGDDPGAGKVDLEAIRQLLALMDEHGLAELEIEQEDMAVRLRKTGAPGPAAPVAASGAGVSPAEGLGAGAEAGGEDEELPTIESPMVGTFYEAPSPEADPLVEVGDHVDESTVVCIIEAMKVFNEIRAEKGGTIEEVLVKNAEAVEFGQALFVIRPD